MQFNLDLKFYPESLPDWLSYGEMTNILIARPVTSDLLEKCSFHAFILEECAYSIPTYISPYSACVVI